MGLEHLGVGGAPLRLETAVNLINELRMLAEDLYVNGYNRYSTAMSKAADELASLERYRSALNQWVDKTEWVQADTTLPAKYLGMHRADVLKDMISELEARCAKWEAVFGHLGNTPDECGNAIIAARDELEERTRRLESALESLLIRCDDSDSAMYGTLSTGFVRDTVRIARGEQT